MKIAVINESYPIYNLAIHKMINRFEREGHEVAFSPRADFWSQECQQAYISAIFTRDLPWLCLDARMLLNLGVTVEVGGPAVTAMPGYVLEHSGITPHIGLDERFEHVPGTNYLATFTSRGCPMGCKFCLVKDVEGLKVIEYDDFPIPTGHNPFVCDNNLLFTSWHHQQLVVEKLKHVRNLDINSGFDCRVFAKDPARYYELYKQLHMESWRFAYDSSNQREPVKECADFLHKQGVSYRSISVFCLCGGDGSTFEDDRLKLQYLIDIGTSPYPMRYKPVYLIDRNYVPPGWGPKDMDIIFGYYGNPFVWRSVSWQTYMGEQNEWQAQSH